MHTAKKKIHNVYLKHTALFTPQAGNRSWKHTGSNIHRENVREKSRVYLQPHQSIKTSHFIGKV